MNNEDNYAAPGQQKRGFILRPSTKTKTDPESPPIVPCCDYVACVAGADYPVMWNPFNKVVQCHNCGHIYVPEPLTNP